MTKAKRNRSRSCDPALNTGVKPDPIIPRRPTDMSSQIKPMLVRENELTKSQ
jgi:hypothetical protein